MSRSDIGDLAETAIFGKQVEIFLEGQIGQYLIQCADIEQENAMAKLKSFDASDAEGIRKLQNEIWRAETIKSWLGEAVNAGYRATMLLEQRQSGQGDFS